MSNPRSNISPSDLTFSWDGCHRCLWLSYNHQLKAPLFMPLVGELADLQERHYKGRKSEDLGAGLPTGQVISHGGWVHSTPISIDGNETPYSIRGKYDLLLKFDDGTYGIIDCKFQAKLNDKSDFYSPQLEAYAFALENPARDEPKQVSVLGLMVWSPKSPRGNPSDGFGLELEWQWYPIKRDPAALQKRFADFIGVISGAMPESKSSCEQCRYINSRREIIGQG